MTTQVATGLTITAIHNQRAGATDTDDEWIRIENSGSQKWNLTGWLITDETDRQVNPHVYQLPERLAGGETWTFDPGEALYLYTGRGTDQFIAVPARGLPHFRFYWSRASFVWNNSGDRVYLRHPNGQFGTQPFPIP